ncbi:MAG: EI24 domain-containing protein [Victivallales bacterium]|nr:EI24 domain-containing protein [Victivallales bacterium]
MKQLITGLLKFFKGTKILLQNKQYWKYAKVSLFLNIIFYIIIFFFLFRYFLPYLDSFLPDSGNVYFSTIFFALIWIFNFVIVITVLLIAALLFNTVFFAITSPYLDGLSVQVEKEVYGFVQIQGKGIKHAIRGYYMSVWNGIWLNFLTVFWVTVLFPLNFIIPVFGYLPGTLSGAYFLGMSFLIYSVEHRMLKRKEFKKVIKGRRLYILGFGLAAYTVLLIPFAAAIFIPGGVLGGTILYNEYFSTDDNRKIFY